MKKERETSTSENSIHQCPRVSANFTGFCWSRQVFFDHSLNIPSIDGTFQPPKAPSCPPMDHQNTPAPPGPTCLDPPTKTTALPRPAPGASAERRPGQGWPGALHRRTASHRCSHWGAHGLCAQAIAIVAIGGPASNN